MVVVVVVVVLVQVQCPHSCVHGMCKDMIQGMQTLSIYLAPLSHPSFHNDDPSVCTNG